MMHWKLLNSSVFAAAAYTADDKTLYLRFRSSELYRYFDVPSELYDDFLAAESHGQFFAQNIRNRFACEHITRIPKSSAAST